ncbi:MAG TPA: dockerin type I domain-containing protein [Candidatus Limnocylindrales bacterium]|nr:dockerin type I domain-containing protein [Candidatus Limnocylindrales bacterium]
MLVCKLGRPIVPLAAALIAAAAPPAGAETVYINDFNLVRAYDTTTRPAQATRLIGEAELGAAGSVTVGPDGRLFVVDRGVSFNKADIVELTAAGELVGTFKADTGLQAPEKMAFGPGGDLFVVTAIGNPAGVYRFDGATGMAEGVYTTGISLNFPFGLAFDDAGKLYVSDTGPSAAWVHRFGTTGVFEETVLVHKTQKAEDMLNHPRGLCWGEDDLLYIVDHFDDVVLRYDPAQDDVEVYAQALQDPHDCVFGEDGTLYVNVSGPRGILPIAPPAGEDPATPGDLFGTDLPGHRILAIGPATLTEGTSTTATSTTTTTETPAIVCGDANDDGDVKASDALIVLRAAIGVGQCALARCDADGSGALTASDALRVLKKAVGTDIAMLCPV